MDLVIELSSEGRIWVSARDGTLLEEAWIPGPDETPTTLRQSGLGLLQGKYLPGPWASTTLNPHGRTGRMGGECPQEAAA